MSPKILILRELKSFTHVALFTALSLTTRNTFDTASPPPRREAESNNGLHCAIGWNLAVFVQRHRRDFCNATIQLNDHDIILQSSGIELWMRNNFGHVGGVVSSGGGSVCVAHIDKAGGLVDG